MVVNSAGPEQRPAPQGGELPSDAFIARQPIFGRDRRVHAYELLSRTGVGNWFADGDGDVATYQTIANSFLLFGIDALTLGKPAFVNVTRNVLLGDAVLALPPDRVVIELLEDIVPDEQAVAACRALKKAGYTLALDDFTFDQLESPAVPFVDIVKVDFLATTEAERRVMVRELRRHNVRLLAEKVEDVATYEAAHLQGFDCSRGSSSARRW